MIGAIATAFLISLILTPLVRSVAPRVGLLDVPGPRSSHTRPTPRSGGIAIVTGVGLSLLTWSSDQQLRLIAASALVIAILGLIDDFRPVREPVKLAIQLGAGLFAAGAVNLQLQTVGFSPATQVSLGSSAFILTVFWVVGVTNAFNFMDGINGIASLEAMVCGVTLAILFLARNDAAAAIFSASIAAAAAGFLPWNFPGGSIFMGDVASGTFGYVFAFLTVRYAQDGVPFVAAVLPLLPFLLDTATTLWIRIWRRERFLTAHRSHWYQRLTATGWSHARVSLVWTLLALIGAVVAVSYHRLGDGKRIAAIVGVVILHVLVATLIVVLERNQKSVNPRMDEE